MSNLTTTNPQQLLYENQLLKIEVLGGLRLEGLDRMRVTLKLQLKMNNEKSSEAYLDPREKLTIENSKESNKNYSLLNVHSSLSVRHNLDLYNDTQVEKLIRKTATKLEIGTSVIEASINELINELEIYRLNSITNEELQITKKELSAEERTKALELLCTSDLLHYTNELIGKSGIIGEETNRLIMYLIFSSRKTEKPLHVISLGSSGTGKTHLQESVAHLIPEEERLEITSLTENAFYYFGQQELKHKLILIEDLDGILQALYPLRELQSKKKISKTIAFKNTKGETKTVHLTVEGPVCIAGCTTQESIYEDNANRSFLLYLDETEAQDQRIMEYQRKISAGKIDIAEQLKSIELLQNSQRLLQNIKVVNPYAELLELPKEVLKPRRTNAHYLQFIEAVTYYHQHQRCKQIDTETGEEYIETTIEDIQHTNQLLKEVLLRKSDILTGKSRNQLEKLKQNLTNIGEPFVNAQVRSSLKISKTMAQNYLNQWLDIGIIKKIHDKQAQIYTYQFMDEKEYKTLENKIDAVLNNAIKNIHKRQTENLPTTNINLSVHPSEINENQLPTTENKKTKDSPKKVEELKVND